MEKEKNKYYVYILCNQHRNVIYVGSTDDLKKRIYFHRKRLIPGFTKKYNVVILVYFEEFDTREDALGREKEIKKYRRGKKNHLVEQMNSEWKDLYEILFDKGNKQQ